MRGPPIILITITVAAVVAIVLFLWSTMRDGGTKGRGKEPHTSLALSVFAIFGVTVVLMLIMRGAGIILTTVTVATIVAITRLLWSKISDGGRSGLEKEPQTPLVRPVFAVLGIIVLILICLIWGLLLCFPFPDSYPSTHVTTGVKTE